MRQKLTICFWSFLFAIPAFAQITPVEYEKQDHASPLWFVFDPASVAKEWVMTVPGEMPEPGAMSEKNRRLVDAERAKRMRPQVNTRGNYSGKPTDKDFLKPEVLNEYNGGGGDGTPNDNHIAVGNDGKFINVMNTVIRVHDETGVIKRVWSLENFVNPPNQKIDPMPTLTRIYDPRVIYDPNRDRYVILFMHGTTDKTSFIVAGFSSTSNPLDPWFVYKIPGKPTKDSIWSDYPIIAHNSEDIFFTVNLIGNGATWEEGFTEAVIWQLRKNDGFKGDTLHKTVYTGIKYEGVALRSICSVQNGPRPEGTDNYFVNVKPIDLVNDTVFLLRVTNTQESGIATLEMQHMRSNLKYGFPPSALQPDTAFKLRTNDCRALSAIRTGNTVQFMQNSVNFKTYQAHLTHQTIFNIDSDPFIRGNMIEDDSLDMGYPAIASAGGDAKDNSSIITFVYSSPWHFPGTAVIYRNRYGEYSSIKKIKKGTSLIYYNYIDTGEQRWGDYEGIQQKYNEPGVFFLVGSYGSNKFMNAWVARVKITDSIYDDQIPEIRVFPIPAQKDLFTEINTTREGIYTLELWNYNGQKVKDKPSIFLNAGSNLLRIDPNSLAAGTYVLHVKDAEGKILLKKPVILL
ncbi:MAG: T9SS type A sorting domain-containing protein [Bacteroidetes bacterium]|nr:T9SS type A sorting domain-containing protein [Bacteroidota bacterium]